MEKRGGFRCWMSLDILVFLIFFTCCTLAHPHSSSSSSSTNHHLHNHFGGAATRTGGSAPPPYIPRELNADECPPDYADHPLVLISMDGFRADFLDRGLTPTIARLAKRGVFAPYIKPSYPSITFPNHFTIVTGLLPPVHGIVANRFTDPLFNETFSPGSPQSFQKRFWNGEPIWKTVENQGQLAATYFWPGSEVVGLNPTYWFPFSKITPFNVRVNQVLRWLDLPRHQRPRFMTLYMHEPDEKAHDTGPDSQQTNEALRLVDETVRQLVVGLQRRRLLDCVNLMIVADHGMTNAGPERVIPLQSLVPDFPNRVTSLWNGIFARFNSKDRSFEGTRSLMQELVCRRSEMKVYHRRHAPSRWHIGAQRRIEDVVLDLNKGYQADGDGTYKSDLGDHGYDIHIADMNALFLAHGPSFRRGMEVEAFQNIELYNLMCLLTDSTPAPNNGTWGSLHHLLQNPPPEDQQTNKEFLIPRLAGFPHHLEREDLEERLEESECAVSYSSGSYKWLARVASETESLPLINVAFWHAPWGMPNIPQASQLRSTLLLQHKTHITAYSRQLRIPLWTSYTLDSGPVARRDQRKEASLWMPDPRLHGDDDAPVCLTRDLLASNGMSWQPLFRHEFGEGGRKSGEEGDLSWLSSNAMVMSGHLEQSWSYLASLVQGWRRRYGQISITAGPVFDADGDSFADDLSQWRVDGDNGGVVLPTHLFVILSRCHLGFGSLHSCPHHHIDTLAFILPQHMPVLNCGSMESHLLEFSAKLKDVELITGLEFLPGLSTSDKIRQQIRIHSHLWGAQTWPNRLRSDLFGLKK